MEIHQLSGHKKGRGRLGRWSITRGSNSKALLGKIWVFCIGGRLREVIAYGGSTVHPFPVTLKEHTFPDILQSFDLYSNNFIEVL